MNWKKVKIGDFLNNRDNRYKPLDKKIKGLKRIDKIDFSGQIYISDKTSNTDMILIKKGDLVISGINVEKGAMNIYEGEEDLTATIHYSSYILDKEKIDLDYLKSFLKSPEFKDAIKEQVPGGIKTEIKPKNLLPLEIEIPVKLEDQKIIVKRLSNQNSKILNLKSETIHQLALLKKLKQQILQDAVKGKLVKQDPKDEPASVLLEKIKAEKEKLINEKKLKPGKPLPPIKDEEIPFQIPENWVWCRLGETSINFKRGPFGSSITKIMFEPKSKETTKIYEQKNAIYKNYKIGNYFIDLEKYPNLKSFITKPGDIIISCAGTIGETYILPNDAPLGIINQALLKLELQKEPILKKYFLLFFESFFKSKINIDAKGSAMKNLGSIKYLKNSIFPLPPLSEQHRIVTKVKELMKKCDELEASIKQGQIYTDQLMQSVLRDALKPGGRDSFE